MFSFLYYLFQNGSTRTDDAQCHTTVFLNCTSERSFYNLRIESNMEQTNASEHATAASLPVTANKTIIAAILGIVFWATFTLAYLSFFFSSASSYGWTWVCQSVVGKIGPHRVDPQVLRCSRIDRLPTQQHCPHRPQQNIHFFPTGTDQKLPCDFTRHPPHLCTREPNPLFRRTVQRSILELLVVHACRIPYHPQPQPTRSQCPTYSPTKPTICIHQRLYPVCFCTKIH